MVKTRHVAKRKKTEGLSCIQSVMFNSDSLFKIASYLPAEGLLNLALTSRRFGVAPLPESNDDDDSLSLVEETARRIVHDIATEEQMSALPRYDDYNWLSKYDYLQLLRMPLTFDQLVDTIEYVEGNKSRVVSTYDWATAFSNNIMIAGKHYASFEVCNHGPGFLLGVMRPREAKKNAKYSPLTPGFFNNFTQPAGSEQYNNSVNCCMCYTYDGYCYSHDWEGNFDREAWDGQEIPSSSCKVGMLLDLDEGTLSVYNNGRKLGVMKRGLAGHYCWVVTLLPPRSQVTINNEEQFP